MLTKQDIFQTIIYNKEAIKNCGVTEIGLFGSYVRDEQTDKSDIDFLVDYEKGQMDFFKFIKDNVRTDPKYLAKYIKSDKTMLFLALFDKTVPFQAGRRLRKEIGSPKTVYLVGNHFTSTLFTGMAKIFPTTIDIPAFPFGYIEKEAVSFYQEKLLEKGSSLEDLYLVPIRFLQMPFNVVSILAGKVFD